MTEIEPGEAGSKAKLEEIENQIESLWPGKLTEDEDEIYNQAMLCLLTQADLGCSVLLAPTPMVTSSGASFDRFCTWLDRSAEACRDLDFGQPLLASIAVSETALDPAAFGETGLLEALVDQVAARTDRLAGAYVVVAQESARHPFETSEYVAEAYLRLCKRLRESGAETLISNFCDLIGLGTLAFGATGTGTGPTQSLCRLALAGFEEREGGPPLPTLYCHASATEYLTEDDVGRFGEHRFFRRILDRTPYSESICDAVISQKAINLLPDWVQSKNNVTAAQLHYLQRFSEEVFRLVSATPRERIEKVGDWLEMADQKQLYIRERLKFNVKGKEAPVASWNQLLNKLS